jgi:hypothetical protein
MSDNFEAFFDAYVECALWSTTDDADESGGAPLDTNYGAGDFDPKSFAELRADAARFYVDNFNAIHDYGTAERAGHDFWLTRNGHGAGFWDGDWPKEVGDKLTKSSKAYGTVDIYLGDDGKLYVT